MAAFRREHRLELPADNNSLICLFVRVIKMSFPTHRRAVSEQNRKGRAVNNLRLPTKRAASETSRAGLVEDAGVQV